jgi:hypothetical protein
MPPEPGKNEPGFLRKIPVPDDEKLGPHEIGPENAEPKAQLAEVVALLG